MYARRRGSASARPSRPVRAVHCERRRAGSSTSGSTASPRRGAAAWCPRRARRRGRRGFAWHHARRGHARAYAVCFRSSGSRRLLRSGLVVVSESLPGRTEPPLCAGSVVRAAGAVLASVLNEAEDAELAVECDGVERDLGRQEHALLGSAGQLDRRCALIAEDALQQLAELLELSRMDLRDRCLEQFGARVTEECTACVVCLEDSAALGVHHEGRFCRPGENLL